MPSYRWVMVGWNWSPGKSSHVSSYLRSSPHEIPWESQVPIGWGQWYSALSKARREGLGLPCLAETTSCGMLTPELNGLETGVANDWLQNSSISHNLFGVDLSCSLFLAQLLPTFCPVPSCSFHLWSSCLFLLRLRRSSTPTIIFDTDGGRCWLPSRKER